MNIERLQLKDNLAKNRQKFKELDIKASSLILAVRTYLNPYEDDVTELETEKAFQSMGELNQIVQEMKDLKIKIHKMERDLE